MGRYPHQEAEKTVAHLQRQLQTAPLNIARILLSLLCLALLLLPPLCRTAVPPIIPLVLHLVWLQYDGYPSSCINPGVCTYVRVNGKDISYEPTTGGKGKSEAGVCGWCVDA